MVQRQVKSMNENIIVSYKKAMNELCFSKDQKEDMIGRLTEVGSFKNVVQKKKKLSVKKIVALTAACLAVLGGCGAAVGKATGVVTSFSPDTFFSKTSDFSRLDTLEKKVGIGVTAVETFSNGYKFDSMDVEDFRTVDDEDRTVGRFKELRIEYVCDNKAQISVNMESALVNGHIDDDPSFALRANEMRTVDGVNIYYNYDVYLGLPASKDISPTEEELKREETDDHFFISIGSDKRETYYASSAAFDMGDVHYCIMTFDENITSNELFGMAEEIIKSKVTSKNNS